MDAGHIDSKVYVMGIDGSNPRLMSWTWDLRWKGNRGRRPEGARLVHHAAGLRRVEKVPAAVAHPWRPVRDVQRGVHYAWQEHAANNYVILYTNPRGSSRYGSAFGNQIMRA